MKNPLKPIDSTRAMQLTGQDTQAFLNRLVTGQLNDAPNGVCRYSMLCDAKGRALYSFWLQRNGSDWLLACDERLADKLNTFLIQRVFRDDVRVSATGQQLALRGPLEEAHGVASECQQLLFTDTADGEAWSVHALMLQLGLPWIDASNSGLFIPNHLGMVARRVASHDKGCYPGQEIIARLHFLGKRKKQLCKLQGESLESLQAGQVLQINGLELQVVHAPVRLGGQWCCFVIAPRDADASSEFTLSESGATAQLKPV